MIIRDFCADDWADVWPIVREVVRSADTFPYSPEMGPDAGRATWIVKPPGRTVVAVDADEVVGTAHMEANHTGPGDHVATGSFMVASSARGRGVGAALCRESLAWARAQGFIGMQFNAVVETNGAAVALYRRLGFEVVGTVPKAFRHPEHGLVGLHIMFCDFDAASDGHPVDLA